MTSGRCPATGNWKHAVARSISLIVLAALLAVPAARADWINLTGADSAPNIAEITVFDDRVEVALEVYVDDLKTLEELIPDDRLKDLQVERPPLVERPAGFSDIHLT